MASSSHGLQNASTSASVSASHHGRHRFGTRAFIVVLVVVLLVACTCSMVMGPSSVGLVDVWHALTGQAMPASTNAIVFNVRLPRIVAALLAGAALAASGAIIQCVLNNPLASPNILGINAGSGLAVLLCASLFQMSTALMPIAAFAGALVTCAIVLLISKHAGTSKIAIVLAGLALTSIFTAGMNTVLIADSNAYVGSSRFLTGGLAGVQIDDVTVPAVCIAVALVASIAISRTLNVLSLGDGIAHSLGMHISHVRIAALLIAALLASSAVCFAGLLGFVGLIIPHIVRFFVGHDPRRYIPASIPAGALFVVVCDLLARCCFAPYEIPVGILMAFIGGPFFIYLILAKRYSNV